jgi:hypothetical protein
MRIVYTYRDKEYRSQYQVRQAVWETDHKVYPAEPSDKTIETLTKFYEPFGVVITEEEEPKPDINQVRSRTQNAMESRFNMLTNDCHFRSSLGFEVNGDATANRNVDMLIRYFPSDTETVSFCGYDNQMHDVKKDDLETLLKEIVANAQYLYQQKWTYREKISKAETIEELDAIHISFSCMKF